MSDRMSFKTDSVWCDVALLCSEHGTCNEKTRKCECEKGWEGSLCDSKADESKDQKGLIGGIVGGALGLLVLVVVVAAVLVKKMFRKSVLDIKMKGPTAEMRYVYVGDEEERDEESRARVEEMVEQDAPLFSTAVRTCFGLDPRRADFDECIAAVVYCYSSRVARSDVIGALVMNEVWMEVSRGTQKPLLYDNGVATTAFKVWSRMVGLQFLYDVLEQLFRRMQREAVLGEMSEDILRDGKKFYESGMPVDGTGSFVTTQWGKIPMQATQTYAFATTSGSRELQDVGLNGLTDAEEREYDAYKEWMDAVIGGGIVTNDSVIQSWRNDPAGDDYHYFRGTDYDNEQKSILDRYKLINNPQGNSPDTDNQTESYDTSYKSGPDVEDINQDYTLNEFERYFQYKVRISPEILDAFRHGSAPDDCFISDMRTSSVKLRNGDTTTVNWYQFRIPLAECKERVGNINDAIRELKEKGVWVFGTAAEGSIPMYKADLTGPAAIVIGNEGDGMSRLVRKNCDVMVSIPMQGRISSLNASAAAAILLYEAVRQRLN